MLLKPSPNLELLVNQFNNATPENNNDPEKISSSKYYDIGEMHNLKIPHKNKSLSLFHINACSLNKNFDDLQHLLSSTKTVFDIIAVSETRITKQVSLLNNLNLNHYSFEFTPTETSAGGTLLYIANHLSYKCRNDLNIYKKNELESTFIEIVNPKKSNIIVGVIYRHPSMDLADFNSNYLNKLLENISKEQKSVFLLGDFNVNLLNYNEHNQTNEFLDSLASNSFIPLILQPTRITSHSNTLIDNIFSNVIEPDIISGNLTATISDHLPQFAIIPNIFGNISGNKYNFYERDWSKFHRQNFILDYFSVDWEDLLKIDKLNAENSTKMYLDAINMLLDTCAPLKRINKYKLKFKSKPWITLGLQKSISVKNILFVNFINKKDPILKEEFHTNYKKYRNLLSTLMKRSKQAYFDKYFEVDWNNIKNTWKGIKSLITLKSVASNVPTVLSLDNGDTITNPYDIANAFNNYFASIAETTKKNIKYSHKHFSDYLANENGNSIFLEATDKEEIANIISSLNSNKTSGPNSIPYRILLLLKNEISKQLADLFNLSFMTGVFPSVLETAKVVPFFKKDSKLDYSNYRPISLLSNVKKTLEKLMYKRLYTFLNSNNIIYNLQFGFRQQYSTSHALVNITENIRKALDGGNIGCGIFVDLQKAFDTVDHQILLTKLNHYGIRGVSNDWFKSYLSNRNQYVSINGFDSGLAAINCGVPQGSVLGPLLFLLFINDLNHTIKFCKVHHFADDTNLLYMSNSIKKLNKLVNADLKHLVHWLNANKISLNVKKTEMMIFKSKQKKFEGDLKIKLCGKRLYPSESAKYLGVKTDTNLNWEHHVNDLSIKLNRANALLFKMRKYVSLKILRSIYFAIFDSYLSYCCLDWAQNSSTIQRIVILQKKLLELLIFNQGIPIPVPSSTKALS